MHYALIEDFGSGLQLLFWAKQDVHKRMPVIFNKDLIEYSHILNVPYLTKLPRILDTDQLVVGKMNKIDKYRDFILSIQSTKKEWTLLLDSWVNYEINENLLPSSIWVTDTWAFELANDIYQKSRVCVIENYLLNHVKEFCLSRTPKYLLYAASPPNNYSGRPREIHGIDCICQDIEHMKETGLNLKICIRFHPGYSRSLCEQKFINKYSSNSSEFHLSNSMYFTQDLQNAEIIFGPISYLHYLSESIKIPSFSTTNPNSNWNGPKFRLV